MSFLKKWASCFISFVAGVLGLALSACSGMVAKVNIDLTAIGQESVNTESVTKAYKTITDSKLYEDAKLAGNGTEFAWLKTFAIIMLVVSILLVIYSIVMCLKNLNVIKSEHSAFDIVGIVLIGLFVVASIALLIQSNTYANVVELSTIKALETGYASVLSLITISAGVSVGAYQWAMLVVSIVCAFAYTTFFILKRKDA